MNRYLFYGSLVVAVVIAFGALLINNKNNPIQPTHESEECLSAPMYDEIIGRFRKPSMTDVFEEHGVSGSLSLRREADSMSTEELQKNFLELLSLFEDPAKYSSRPDIPLLFCKREEVFEKFQEDFDRLFVFEAARDRRSSNEDYYKKELSIKLNCIKKAEVAFPDLAEKLRQIGDEFKALYANYENYVGLPTKQEICPAINRIKKIIKTLPATLRLPHGAKQGRDIHTFIDFNAYLYNMVKTIALNGFARQELQRIKEGRDWD